MEVASNKKENENGFCDHREIKETCTGRELGVERGECHYIIHILMGNLEIPVHNPKPCGELSDGLKQNDYLDSLLINSMYIYLMFIIDDAVSWVRYW